MSSRRVIAWTVGALLLVQVVTSFGTVALLGKLAGDAKRAGAGSDLVDLATGGAWAAAFLGVIGLVLSVVAVLRLSRTILRPLADLQDVARAHQSGDLFRRTDGLGAHEDFRVVAQSLDQLLDKQLAYESRHVLEARKGEAEHAALLRLLDEAKGAAIVLDAEGHVRAANQTALALLAEDSGEALKDGLVAACRDGADAPEGATTIALGDAGFLCRVPVEPTRADAS